MTRVLVVEDEESYSDALAYMLRKEGFEVSLANTGPDAIVEFEKTGADIVLLDLMLPGMPGTEVCRRIRQTSNVPVIMVSAKDSEVDKVVGLELGADDYVTKPYAPRELVARIRAVLRRGQEVELAPATLEAGPVRMDVERHVVTVNGEDTKLPLKEFELLEMFLRNPGRVLTRGQLIDRVWGSDYVGDTKTLDVHVKRLRAKIEPDPGQPDVPHHRARPRLQARALRSRSQGARVHRPAVAQHHEVQVAAGREAGRADVPDDVALADPLPAEGGVAAEVVVRRGEPDPVAEPVRDHDPVAVGEAVVAGDDHAACGRPHRASARTRRRRGRRAASTGGRPGAGACRTVS